MPSYRVTLKGENGQTWEYDVLAPSLPAVAEHQGDVSHLIEIEGIDRTTGEALGGM